MNRKRVKEFKEKLVGLHVRMETGTGGVVAGHLANSAAEKKIFSESNILVEPDDYFLLINMKKKTGSFLLASDIETIDVITD